MPNLVLVHNGQRVGLVSEDVALELPDESWEVVAEDEAPEPIATPEPPETNITIVSTFVPFSQHPLFEQARDAAKTNPAIQVEFVTAMYASNQGDASLLQSAIENLEELLE